MTIIVPTTCNIGVGTRFAMQPTFNLYKKTGSSYNGLPVICMVWISMVNLHCLIKEREK